MNRIKIAFIFILLAGGLVLYQPLGAQYAVSQSVFGSGGGVTSGSGYRIIGTLGQPAIGETSNPSYINKAGFWYVVFLPDFSAVLTVLDVCGNTINLTFGTAFDATDGYDPRYDQYAPPPPPPGAFDARFRVGGEDFVKDFRVTIVDVIIWDVYFQPASGCEPITLTWNDAQFPDSGSFRLRNSGVDVDMRTQNSYTVTNIAMNHLQIVYSLEVPFAMPIAGGWNLIGLPLEVVDRYYLHLFPNAIPNTLFGWNGAYYSTDSLYFGNGYWLRFPAPESVTIFGTIVNSLTLDLLAGWNMISGPSCDIALSDVNDPGGILIPGTLFGFDGAYFPADSIKQGHGYWIRTTASGQISMTCGSKSPEQLAKKGNVPFPLDEYPSLTLSDGTGASQMLHYNVKLDESVSRESYSLPPLPPAGAFDVRFQGDYRISEGEEATIQIQSSHYPVSLSASHLPVDKDYHYVIQEIVNGDPGRTHILKDGEQVVITDPQVTTLKLSKERIVPLTFSLSQNYPNPFNPTTTIKYSLPTNEQVELVIYNALGQKVRTLVSEYQKAGYYEVVWDATADNDQQVGSGIFFYRIKAGKHTAIKKMLVLK
ncbi:MAG: hypothetical protein Kow0042_09360 [Calditrichia bacterium]